MTHCRRVEGDLIPHCWHPARHLDGSLRRVAGCCKCETVLVDPPGGPALEREEKGCGRANLRAELVADLLAREERDDMLSAVDREPDLAKRATRRVAVEARAALYHVVQARDATITLKVAGQPVFQEALAWVAGGLQKVVAMTEALGRP